MLAAAWWERRRRLVEAYETMEGCAGLLLEEGRWLEADVVVKVESWRSPYLGRSSLREVVVLCKTSLPQKSH